MHLLKRGISRLSQQKWQWKRFLWDTLLALMGTLVMTMTIYWFRLYPRIPNISLIYLVAVLALAGTRGLYAAVLSSLVAFLSFDYFLIQPLYTFSITRPEEWLALFIFLCAAIITGQLAVALRARAEQAHQREQETRILYELLRDTNNIKDLAQQLEVVAGKIVTAFEVRGVRACLILLPDEQGKLIQQARAGTSRNGVWMEHPDELTTAAWVMREGLAVDFYPPTKQSRSMSPLTVIRSSKLSRESRHYLSFFPLKVGQRVCGVLGLTIEDRPGHSFHEKRLGSEEDRSDPRSTLFWTCLDQTTSMIEHNRLRRESLQVEVLQRTDTLRAALLSSVSHDLRTPLTSIKAAASSLLQEDVRWNDEERRSFTQSIEQEADRLNRLVENLLDLSRIESGALKPEKEWYPLNGLLHDVLARMQPLLNGRLVTIDLAADLPPAELDYLMIDQVFTNLLENTLRYTPAESPIEVVVQTDENELTVSVADRGPGIPENDLERIFDKFYRVLDRAHEIGGTGVGLAVCRGLIEAHGGRIWAANRPGGGASLRFTLPLRHTPIPFLLTQIEEARA